MTLIVGRTIATVCLAVTAVDHHLTGTIAIAAVLIAMSIDEAGRTR